MSVSKNRRPKFSEKGNAKFFENAVNQVSPDQVYREIVVNAFEAHERMRKIKPDHIGEVVVRQSQDCPGKFEIGDNGIGMPKDKVVDYITDISETEEESEHGNHGLGGKICGFANNQEGMVYVTQRYGEDEGSYCRTYKDESGSYGTEHFDYPDNSCRMSLDSTKLPKIIKKSGHGTVLTLLGNSPEQNTYKNPPKNYSSGLLKGTRKEMYWLKSFFNTKFFRIPAYVNFKIEIVREDRENFENIIGHEACLNNSAIHKGCIENDAVKIYWYILSDQKMKRHSANDRVLNGQLTTIHNDEVIDIEFERQGAKSPLRNWGLDFSFKDVAIVLEPKGFKATQHRDDITKNNAKLKTFISEYRQFFMENMPEEIKKYEEEKQKMFSKKMDDDYLHEKEMLQWISDTHFVNPKGDEPIKSETLFGHITTTKGTHPGHYTGKEGSVEPGLDVKSEISTKNLLAGVRNRMAKQKGKKGIINPLPKVELVSNQEEWVVYNWDKHVVYLKSDIDLLKKYAEKAFKQNNSKPLSFHENNTLRICKQSIQNIVCMIRYGHDSTMNMTEETRRDLLGNEHMFKIALINAPEILKSIVNESKHIQRKINDYESKKNEMEQTVRIS